MSDKADGDKKVVEPDTDEGGASDEKGDGEKGADEKGVDTKALETADRDTLLATIATLNEENGNRRRQAKDFESENADLTKRLTALEDAAKTEDEREAERITELEAKAAQGDAMGPFKEHVRAELETELKRVEKLKAAQKGPYTDLLAAFGENDILGRLKAVRALRAAEGDKGDVVAEGDEGNPVETGTADGKPNMSELLGWSEGAELEGKLAGMLPKGDD